LEAEQYWLEKRRMDDQDLLKVIPANVVENIYSNAVSMALKKPEGSARISSRRSV